jgi:lipopolysaccharide/colanic/teichoic acid biosynthesis glycosyltransferase
LDVTLGVVLLCVSAPLFGLIALAVFISSGWPVFFVHERVGRHGRTFHMVKFRTMIRDAVPWLHNDVELWEKHRNGGFKLPVNSDPRVTKLGRLLRRASLDELPQLLNVVAGSMSLVGPRPVVAEELPLLFGQDTGPYLAVRPGMTGPWQVSGRSALRWHERSELELDYFPTWSFRLDLLILIRTVSAVLHGVDSLDQPGDRS